MLVFRCSQPLKIVKDIVKERNVEYQTRRTDMPWLSLIGGIALGALAMYIADPVQGRRRRALLQDKLLHATHVTSKKMDQTLHDARNRWSGVQTGVMRLLSSRQAKPIDDHVLEARVRSRLGRAMSHVRDVEVHAHQGQVTLSGSIDAEVQEKIQKLVATIPGVESVSGPTQPEIGQASLTLGRNSWWVASAAAAGVFTWYALTRRQPLGLLAAATGLGLMSRGSHAARAQRRHLRQQGGDAYEAECTIDIDAPPEVVFDIWNRYENFPHFMSYVTEVRDLGDNRSHWIVQGPGGTDVEWNSVLTVSERPHRLAWRSEPEASVDHEGTVSLEPVGDGTRAWVRLSWRSPTGTAAEALAVLTGTDPQHALREDLHRMKEFIERGLPSRAQAGTLGGGNVLH
jgi:uncharacterized membrane protein